MSGVRPWARYKVTSVVGSPGTMCSFSDLTGSDGAAEDTAR